MGVRFDGIDDRLEHNGSVVSGYPFTLYAKFKLNTVSGINNIITLTDINSDNNYLYFRADDTPRWAFFIRNSGGSTLIETNSPPLDTDWHTVFCVSRASNDHELFIDGASVATSSSSQGFPSGLDRYLLAFWTRQNGDTENADVDIDESAIWSTDLSNSEITQVHNNNKGEALNVQFGSLLVYNPLDDFASGGSADGLNFSDSSGNNIELTGNDGANNTGLTIIDPQDTGTEELIIEETITLGEDIDIHSNAVDMDESVVISDNFDINPTKKELNINETIQLSDVSEISIPQDAPFATKIISINPLIFITDDSPPKISKIDTTDPENPVATTAILSDIDSAQDVSVNTANNFVYVAGTNGKIVKVEIADLNNQTIIDVSDTDDLLTIETNSNFGITYAGTENEVGELYVIDERTTFSMDSDFQVIAPMQFSMDSDFNVINTFKMDSDFQVLAEQTFIVDTDFKCITKPTVPPPPTVSPLDVLEPIKLTDYQVFVDSVELEDTDLILDSISITHSESEQSRATFRLTRKHDQLNTTLQGNLSTITNQNAVEIKANGVTIFPYKGVGTGNISDLNCQYNDNIEFVEVNALSDEATNQFNCVTLSLPSLDSRLSLYDILIQNPNIFYGSVADEDDDNPKKFKGIRVNLGQIIKQIVIKKTENDSTGIIAALVQAGNFNPIQNWTYFWGTVRATNFGTVDLGDNAAQTFFYIGTSLSPVSEELWNLTNASHHRQRIYDDEIIKLGDGTLTVSDLNGLVDNPSSIHGQLGNKGFLLGNIITNKFKKTVDSDELKLIGVNINEQTAVYEEMEKQLGFTVGEAPFQEVSVRNGIFVTKPKWVDEPDRLSNNKEAGNNFVEYAKEIARLEYEKLKNINGNILPDTSCTFNLTIDAYLYYGISLLTKINVDNTTESNIYNGANGFPVSAKSITITSADRRVIIEADNIKSTKELEELNGQFPSEDDDEYNEKEQRVLIAIKSNMKTGLNVE